MTGGPVDGVDNDLRFVLRALKLQLRLYHAVTYDDTDVATLLRRAISIAEKSHMLARMHAEPVRGRDWGCWKEAA